MSGRQQPVLREIVYDVLKQVGQPMPLAEITQEVLRVRPSKAKRPEVSVRNVLTREIYAVNLGDEGWALPSFLLDGCLLRCTPRRWEVEGGFLFTGTRLSPFFPLYPQRPRWHLMDERGQLVHAPRIMINYEDAMVLTDWFEAWAFKTGDSIIVRALDVDEGRYQLIHEPAGEKKQGLVAEYNRMLADAVCQVLEAKARWHDVLWLSEVIPPTLPRLPFAKEYPPDDYLDLFAYDPRIRLLEGWKVALADYRRPLDILWEDRVDEDTEFLVLNPGFIGPVEEEFSPLARSTEALLSLLSERMLDMELEEGEEFSETFDPAEHWIDLLSLDIVEVNWADGNLVFRFNFASALGDFVSADEVAITTEDEMAETALSLIRQRYRTIVRAQLQQNPSVAEVEAIKLAPEDAIEDIIDYFADLVDAEEDFAEGTLSEWEMARLQETELDFADFWDEDEEEWW